MSWKYIPLAVMAAMGLAGGTAQAQNLVVDTVTGAPGQEVTVNISTDAAVKNLAGIQFVFSFGESVPTNAPKLVLGVVKPGPFLPSPLATTNPLSNTSFKTVQASSESRSGAGVLLTVPLTIPTNAAANTLYKLNVTSIEGSDFNGNPVRLTAKNGTLTVKAGTGGNPGGNPSAVGLVVSDGTGPAGGIAPVDVALTDKVSGVSSLQMTLRYDSSLSLKSGDVAFTGLIDGLKSVNDAKAGEVTFAVVSTDPAKGAGVVARLNFKVPATAKAGATFPLTISDLQLSDSNGNLIATTGSAGKITVGTAGTPTTPPTTIAGGLVKVESGKAGRNGVANVAVTVNNKVTNLSGATFRLVYAGKTPANAPNLIVQSGAKSTLLPDSLVNVTEKAPGELVVGVISTGKANGPGALITIPFKVDNAPAGAAYSFEIKDLVLSVNDQDAFSATEGGTLTITGRKKGDINGDEKLSTTDVTLALRGALGLLQLDADQASAADLNGDGKVTVSEVTLLLRAALGLVKLEG